MTSRTFEDLEKRCKAIKRKRYAKWFFIVFILFFVAALAYYISFSQKKVAINKGVAQHKENRIKDVKKSKIVVKVKEDVVVHKQVSLSKPKTNSAKVENIVKKEIKKSKKSKEHKSVIKKTSIEYNTIFLKPKISIPKSVKPEKLQMRKLKVVPAKENISKYSADTKKKKVTIRVKSLKDEEALLRDNGMEEDFDTTIRLSNYYYNKSKFQKAIYWSKKANQYKPSSFKPWYIYAKAKIKQHKKRDAIRAVEAFLSYFDSNDARKFLRKIKGK